MEQVLDLYQKPYDPDCPVVCMDEQPVQLVKETRPPMAATKNRPRRVDYEYERAGTAAVFLFSEPLAGWRQATARARRTKVDWALEVAGLLEGRYADCEKITLVCDHLNVYPHGFEGTKLEPPFEGLICAYNSSCGGGDFATARRPRVRAGTPSSYTPVSTATAISSTAEPTARSRSRAPTT